MVQLSSGNFEERIGTFLSEPKSASLELLQELTEAWSQSPQDAAGLPCFRDLRRKVLDLISCKDVSEEVQSAAAELFDVLELAQAEALEAENASAGDKLEVSPTEAMRDWWLGNAPDFALPSSGSHVQEHAGLEQLSCQLHSCNKREKIRSPIANTMYPGSQLLARLLLSCPELVAGKEVLEIGAGFHGIPSMAAYQAGCRRAVVTDVDTVALHQLKINLEHGLAGKTQVVDLRDWDESTLADGQSLERLEGIAVTRLDWSAPEASAALGRFQVLIASEIIHEKWMGPLVLDVITRCLQPGGIALIMNAASYHRFGVEEFQELLEQTGASQHQAAVETAPIAPEEAGSRRLTGRWMPVSDLAQAGIDSTGLTYDCYILQVLA